MTSTERLQARERTEALAFLHQSLASGERPSGELKEEAKLFGISGQTLRRAVRDAGIKWRREGFGRGARYFWSLPTGQAGLQARVMASMRDHVITHDAPPPAAPEAPMRRSLGPRECAAGCGSIVDIPWTRCADCQIRGRL